MILKILFPLLFFTQSSKAANILAILPSPSYSHQIAYTHIWKELSLRGHQVTVITTDPLNDPELKNLTEVDMKWCYKLVANISKLAENEFTMWSMHYFSNSILSQIREAQLEHPDVQNLIHNKTHFDVVLVEFLYPELLAFAEIYNCPKILFATLGAMAVIHQALGNPIHPVLYPDMGSTFHGSLTFKERVISTLYTWYVLYYYTYDVYVSKDEVVRKYFNISRTVHELISDVDMLFINVNPILQPIRALGPSTIAIGGNREIVSSTALPRDIADFLDSAKEGFVYFSLGSNVKSKDLSKENLEAIKGALSELPYKVLWKFEADVFPNKPKNVKLIKWSPQQTVLSHRNIKTFVTQGGLQSIEEAFYSEVPLVVIPFFGDQDQNARIIESKGFAVVVNRRPSINKLELKNAILDVINNPKYRNTIKRLRKLALDSPMTGLEKAVWWTEYVIRNKGAKHLRNPAADLPYYQYYLVDVISFLLLCISAVLIGLYLVSKTVYRYITMFLLCCTNKSIVDRKKEE